MLPQRYKFSSKSQQTQAVGCIVLCCCCYRKGTNFQANHNVLLCRTQFRDVVVATAKVQIFKQITTASDSASLAVCCCCYRKGTNFQANHNFTYNQPRNLMVVVATAKVQIFKQITTVMLHLTRAHKLLLLPQRYKFSSKSQRIMQQILRWFGCCCYRKFT